MNVTRIRAEIIACAVAMTVTATWSQDWSAVKLNGFAVTNAFGSMVMLSSPGGGYTPDYGPDKAFDGNTETRFDTYQKQETGGWAGYELQTAKIVTRVRYIGSPGWEGRMVGGLFQGANTADFSDAMTLHEHTPPAGWIGTNWIDVTTLNTLNAFHSFKFLRFIATGFNSMGGDVREVEFYGTDPQTNAPPIPVLTFADSPNWHASLHWTATADPLIYYELQRKRSYENDFSTVWGGFYSAAGARKWRDAQPIITDTHYRLRAVNSFGPSAWCDFTAVARNAAVGTRFGATGHVLYPSANLYDSDCDTFLDTYGTSGEGSGSQAWAALDLGSPRTITGIRYTPRRDRPGRMTGGRFEAADNTNFTGAVTLHTVPSVPPLTNMTEYVLGSPTGPYRYVRYVSPWDGWGNAGELEYDLAPSAPVAPNGLAVAVADFTNGYPVLTWTFEPLNIDSCRVYRATDPDGTYTAVASGIRGNTWSDTSLLSVGKSYYYKVCALDAEGGGDGPLSAPIVYRRYERLERAWETPTAIKPGMSLITVGAVNFGLETGRMFDGDLNTFPDISPANSTVGVDLGRRYLIGCVRVSARANLVYRLNGAELRGSNSATLAPYTTLATFSNCVAGAYTTVPATSEESFRYIFVTKDSGEFNSNVAELELYGVLKVKGTLIKLH